MNISILIFGSLLVLVVFILVLSFLLSFIEKWIFSLVSKNKINFKTAFVYTFSQVLIVTILAYLVDIKFCFFGLDFSLFLVSLFGEILFFAAFTIFNKKFQIKEKILMFILNIFFIFICCLLGNIFINWFANNYFNV